MAFNLLSLLGQAAGAELPPIDPNDPNGNGNYDVNGNNAIVVSGNNLRYDPRMKPEEPRYAEPDLRPEITPKYILQDDRMKPSETEMQELLPRKGMFGTKGTLRDILGTLGDAFLMQGGADRIYAPQRDREKQSDAMYGFTDNPMQAMERLNAAGFAKESQDVYKDYTTLENNKAILNSQENARKNLADDRNYTNLLQGKNQVARWLAAAKTPAQLEYVMTQLAPQLAKQLNVGLEQLGLPNAGGVTPEQQAVLAAGDMTVNQQELIPRRDRQLDISQENATTGRISATRPREFAPKSATNVQTWIGEDGYQYTQRSDGATVRSTTKVQPKGKGTGRRAVSPPTTTGKRPPLSSFNK